MDRKQLDRAIKLAKERQGIPFHQTNIEQLTNFASRDFIPLYLTLVDVADLIRWEATNIFDGRLDLDAINLIAKVGRQKFLIIG